MKNIDQLAIDTVRILSVEMIQRANSGHPGMPLGAAPLAYTLWAKHLKHNPENPCWQNRDRFVLSAGHGSSMLYSLLHIFGYDMSLQDLKNFRCLHSKTPGHPEYRLAPGVESTTGPLGQGIAMGVGMAIAEARLAGEFNKEGFPIVDHYTYVLIGDGCIQEGAAQEACSLAGNLALGKLILLYDKNDITIEGNIDITFSEDVAKRYEAYGWQVLTVEDGNTDICAIEKAIELAKAEMDKPSLIIAKTTIGYGCPPIAGDCHCHGNPLGDENIALLKATLDWPHDEPFYVPSEVKRRMAEKQTEYTEDERAWNAMLEAYAQKYPGDMERYNHFFSDVPSGIFDDDSYWRFDEPMATRASSGEMLNRIAKRGINLMGGSADLEPCNNTYIEGKPYFSALERKGPNVHFGIREFSMAAICNGMALHGGIISYCATFLVFADYVKPALRLSSIMKLPVIYILTHDSIGIGEDGITHQPIEQLAMLRSQPDCYTFRPADSKETAAAYQIALTKGLPVCLALSRQQLPLYDGTGKGALKGAYILLESETPDVILIGTGSELELCQGAYHALKKEGINARVVSMPCMELFEEQSKAYKKSVLPDDVAVVIVEAGSVFGWQKYIGQKGESVTLDHFGASASAEVLFKEYGFTVENVVNKAQIALSRVK